MRQHFLNIIIALTLTLTSINVSGQGYQVDPVLTSIAQKSKAKHVYTVSIVIDKSSSRSAADIKEVMDELNTTYYKTGNFFKVIGYRSSDVDLNSKGAMIPSIRILKKISRSDITIYITGHHTGTAIGAAMTGGLHTSRSLILVDLNAPNTNKDCSRVVAHEIGHLFGLRHGSDESFIMSTYGNESYSNTFTSGNLSELSK